MSVAPPPTPPPPTPTPPPPPSGLENIIMLGLDPNEAGQTNTITVTDATPGSTVKFRYSTKTGSTVISGGVCDGQTLDMGSAKNLQTVIADGMGTAIMSIGVPSSFSGKTVYLQAFSETATTCGLSNLLTQTIQ